MTHAGTQTVCVTQPVTHCCPPALLAQLCTSETGLELKTAGEATGQCAGPGGRVGFWTGPSDYYTPTQRNAEHLCLTRRPGLVCVSCEASAVEHSPQNPGTAPPSGTSWRPRGPSDLLSPCFHTRIQQVYQSVSHLRPVLYVFVPSGGQKPTSSSSQSLYWTMPAITTSAPFM